MTYSKSEIDKTIVFNYEAKSKEHKSSSIWNLLYLYLERIVLLQENMAKNKFCLIIDSLSHSEADCRLEIA